MYIVTVFVARNVLSFALLTAATVLLTLISGISVKTVIKGIKPILYILIFTFIINVFWREGKGDPLFSFWIITVYEDGIYAAALMALRIIVLITGTSLILTYTTSPIMLTDGLEQLLYPLKAIKLPVHEFAMMMTIALRFIPTLIEETEKIMNAQSARGASFTSGSIISRAKALIPVLVPLFVSSFKRADDLAVAMECRCYRGGEGRTRMTKLSYGKVDLFIFLGAAVLLAGVILINTYTGDFIFSL